jgi:hypothetical protein
MTQIARAQRDEGVVPLNLNEFGVLSLSVVGRARSCRRGIVLLLVLSLLTILAAVLLTFTLSADRFHRSAEVWRRHEECLDPPERVLRSAFAQVVRGGRAPAPTAPAMTPGIHAHSLLESMYGNRAMGGSFRSIEPVAGGNLGGKFQQLKQLLEIRVTAPSSQFVNRAPAGSVTVDPWRCVGCVLTFLSGPCPGRSTRILAYREGTNRFQILANEDISFSRLNGYLSGGNAVIDYVVNSVPFSGSGFGWGLREGAHEITDAALLPNARCNADPEHSASAVLPSLAAGAKLENCSANSDYTAVDYQHMLLAMMLPSDAAASNGGVSAPIPSMHRPELILYWLKNNPVGIRRFEDFARSPENVAMLGQMMFRPLGAELKDSKGNVSPYSPNPLFTGSNPKFNPLWDGTPGSSHPGCWDVDNDGDGVPDSIWLDLGFPVRYGADGKAYKPLTAILCVDMDGRLNLNAHGCPEQLSDNYYQATDVTNPARGTTYLPPRTWGPYSFTGDPRAGDAPYADPLALPPRAVAAVPLAKGQGYGPAEINLKWLLAGASPKAYARLLGGANDPQRGTIIEGRYGDNSLAAKPGRPGRHSPLLLNKWFEYGGDYWSFMTSPANYAPDAYGTPPGMTGNCSIGLDLSGHPIYYGLGDVSAQHPINSPYELDLRRPGAWRCGLSLSGDSVHVDNPFTQSELERLLRPFDRDAPSLPSRLADLLGNDAAARIRNEVTTEQWDLPVPATAIPPTITKRDSLGASIVDLLRANSVPQPLWPKLITPDLLSGLRMDINRPFGPGRDDSGKGVPDAPRYASTASFFPRGTPCKSADTGLGVAAASQDLVRCDAGNTGDFSKVPATEAADYGVREAYARSLYMLACLLCDKKGLEARARAQIDIPNNYKLSVQEKAALLLAQWAVNVVDFRDRDSIMTCFHYDPNFYVNPAAGWKPTAIVFGCERPELLIMETLAFHDRRTEDLATERVDPTIAENALGRRLPGSENETNPAKTDNDFDQQWRPQGSLFVKLFNPGSQFDAPCGDLHKSPLKGWSTGVHLDQMTPPANGLESPVWRLAFTKPPARNEIALPDPDNPIGFPTDLYAPDRPVILRSVYFVDLSQYPTFARTVVVEQAAVFPGAVNYPYYPSSVKNPAGIFAPVLPGRYAVIGSAEADPAAIPAGTSRLSTPIGLAEGGHSFDTSCRQIVLDPRAGQVRIVNSLGQQPPPGSQPAVVVPVDSAFFGGPLPRRLSVSEPDPPPHEYYPTVDPYGRPLSAGRYTTPYDHSLDEYRHGKAGNGASPPRTAGPTQTPDVWPLMSTSRDVDATELGRGFRTVHLQRLANPLIPWNNDPASPQFNPYLTVDSMAVDLSIFNGVSSKLAKRPTNPAWERNAGVLHLASRERGMNDFFSADLRGHPMNLWKQEAFEHAPPVFGPYIAGYPPAPGQVVTAPLVQSLGSLNHAYGRPRTELSDSIYAGGPPCPMPWLTWNDRPYISPLELLLVPWTSSSQLMRPMNFTIATAFVETNPFVVPPAPPAPPYYDASTNPFVHLMNFFDSGPVGASPQMHRVLEYLRVPSRFLGTELELNPVALQNGAGTHLFHPPFNRVSTYREPGRINVNTVFSSRVWQGLMNGFPDPSASPVDNSISWGYTPPLRSDVTSSGNSQTLWARFIWSRRGYANTGDPSQQDNFLYIDPDNPLPTRFANPVRSYAGQALSHRSQRGAMQSEIDSTLLRRDPAKPARPLFQYDATITPRKSDGLKLSAIQHPENPDRNPYFRYAGLQRLSNLTTTRSNIYAVWITVGYFEVMPNHFTTPPGQPDELHPDGFELGQEMGSDSGDIVRHRAFFLFDRTVPMGFIRGEDLPFDRGVLVERMIE